MIGLVGLRVNGPISGVDVLGGLPSPPATAWSAFLVGLGTTVSLEDVLLWAAPVRRVRPFLPVGIVGDLRQRDTKVLDAMSAVGLALSPVLQGSEAPAGFVRREVVEELREASVEGKIAGEWLERWGVTDPMVAEILRAAATRGVRAWQLITDALGTPGGM